MKKPYQVYAAGPDVFVPGAAQHFEYARELALECNIELLVPFDVSLTTGPEIYLHNVWLIDKCDGLIANLSPFRGTEPDSGTVWELSRAVAQGKPAVAYLNDHRTVRQRVQSYFSAQGHAVEDTKMPDGMYVENFGHPLNLMLALSCRRIVPTLSEALLAIEGELDRRAALAALAQSQG